MQSLLYFVSRYYPIFVFLLLEIISYNLIVRYNIHQRTIYHHSVDVWTSSVDNKISTVKNYFRLQKIADSLVTENARLASAYHNLLERNKDKRLSTINKDSTYVLVGARVLNNSLFKRHNTFTINKGQEDGIEPGQGVIHLKGIAGIVKNTSPHFAVVMSLLNPSVRISSKIQNKPYFGTLHWNGGNLEKVGLFDIPKYAELHRGDTIVTSGYSSVFPPDLPIGSIEKFHVKEGSDVYSIEVKLFAVSSSLDYVYIVKNNHLKEIQSLQTQ